ncbi:hypothetical protein BDA99DRAFT_523617 [Phascolomyces articulosus]|uniref:Uncharacterized protein n=1 Tax=Phascolomyces articulosus TaxID=60185 RepID=A0AAD5K430_9FUNG|nr:hypothetical protein BDA99DRAFT_523617 [Phascolomyces articulosus]
MSTVYYRMNFTLTFRWSFHHILFSLWTFFNFPATSTVIFVSTLRILACSFSSAFYSL